MTVPVRIGMIDTGVNAAHPHVGNIAGGVTIRPDGDAMPCYEDRLGHGTAIAALLHQQAPEAQLIAVKVFDRTLATNRDSVIHAIDWCLQNEVDIINLSLGTANPAHRNSFEDAVRRTRANGKAIVSAHDVNGALAFPGCLPGVIAVVPDTTCSDVIQVLKPGETYESPKPPELSASRSGRIIFSAPPYPREIPGVPRERNLHGVSFAVAHVTAALARLWPAARVSQDWESTLANALLSFQSVDA
jgi:subtilisin family serine protease